MKIPISYIQATPEADVSLGLGGFRIEMRGNSEVRVSRVIQQSVGFIGEASDEDSAGLGGDLCATGFFVCVPFASAALAHKRWGYFVTAAHVAKDLHRRPIYFLVNKKGGGVTGLQSIGDWWWSHPTDPSVDAVVIPVALNRDADMSCVAVRDFVTAEDFARKHVGVGDEVFITGLFTAVPGVSEIMPLVRHGNIAMLPKGQVQTEMGYADVHLVEARSIGGLSGSPVYIKTDDPAASYQGIKLLGLMHGHWDIKESELNKPTIAHDRRGVNLGIGIVVPAAKILEIINQSKGVEWREEMEAQMLKEMMPGTDSVKPKEESEEPFTRTAFESALQKVSRKITPKE